MENHDNWDQNDKLKKLLDTWNVSMLYEKLCEYGIDYNSLKCIRKDHLNSIFGNQKNFFGPLLLFEEAHSKWMKQEYLPKISNVESSVEKTICTMKHFQTISNDKEVASCNQNQIHELKTLLETWNVSVLYEYLCEYGIDYSSLKCIRKDHLNTIFGNQKKFFGPILLFEEAHSEWIKQEFLSKVSKAESSVGESNGTSTQCKIPSDKKGNVELENAGLRGRQKMNVEPTKIELTKIENSENYFDEQGYVYSRNNSPKLKTCYFRCKNSSGQIKCPARAKAKNKDLRNVILTKKHNHGLNRKVLYKTKFDKKLDKVCKENKFMLPRDLYFKARDNITNDEELAHIPERKGYRSFIHYRQRETIPKIPHSFEEFEELLNNERYKEQYCFDKRNNIFYRGMYTTRNGHTMTVFVSEEGLKMLKEMKLIELLMDGTFKILPRHLKFTQFYIMSFIYEERCYPFAYIFMEKRDFEAYVLLFEILKELMQESATKVSKCMTDYEAAVRKAFKIHFPHARLCGCFFHYVKAIHKAARRFGLSKDPTFDLPIRKVAYLALLPNEYILKGFIAIHKNIDRSSCIFSRWERFIKYWSRQWRNANISVYGLPNRCNNFAESLNKSFNMLNGRPHQNIWYFLNTLKKMEMDKTDELLKHKAGKIFDKNVNQSTKNLNKKISDATRVFKKTLDVERFLRNVTYDDNMEDFLKDRLFIETVDDECFAEDYDAEEEFFPPNDFDVKCNFHAYQQPILLKRNHAETIS